mgnify:CR=1 FL=1
MSRLYMMVTITDRNRKKKFEEFYEKNEHMVFFTTLGRGTANSEMLDYFGLEESEKVVILSVVTEETWKKLRREMIVKDADRRAGNRNCIYRATQQHRRRKNITFPDTEREI